MKNLVLLSTIASVVLAAKTTFAGDLEITGSLGAEARVFFEDGRYPTQLGFFQGSLQLQPDIRWYSDDNVWDIVVVPYARLDAEDNKRTHVDLREAYVRWNGDSLSVRAGLGKVFWGVAESRHLVDIINQSDAIEDLDEEDKFGQPMLEASWQQDWGQLTGFILPAFRKRIFPGEEGRLRGPLLVKGGNALFDEGKDSAGVDIALRYSHYFGDWDIGLSAFHGTSREARFVLTSTSNALQPVYDDITQVGLDLQYTVEAWLWKFEAIVRDTPFETFFAGVGGLEYSFYGITESGADLGVLIEFQYDGRSTDPAISPLTPADNDIMIGARLAQNDAADTAVLAGVVADAEDGSMSGILEASRRIGSSWVAEIEGRFFMNVEDTNVLAPFKDDSHVMLRMTRYF